MRPLIGHQSKLLQEIFTDQEAFYLCGFCLHVDTAFEGDEAAKLRFKKDLAPVLVGAEPLQLWKLPSSFRQRTASSGPHSATVARKLFASVCPATVSSMVMIHSLMAASAAPR